MVELLTPPRAAVAFDQTTGREGRRSSGRLPLFYKTRNGAKVGDLFMSLIYTCQLNEANPFDYLTELQQHAEVLAACPERWMPWNYRDASS